MRYNSKKGYLNIARINYQGTYALGPGRRFAIWLQGCPFSCKNCTTPEYIPFTAANWVETEKLAKIISSLDGFDGLTISGGEPLAQSMELLNLLSLVRRNRPDLSIILFTGFTLARIQQDTVSLDTIKQVDVLIDGLYVDQLNDNKGLRGSTNQRFHFITDRLKPYQEFFYSCNRIIEFSIDGNYIRTTGINPAGFTL